MFVQFFSSPPNFLDFAASADWKTTSPLCSAVVFFFLVFVFPFTHSFSTHFFRVIVMKSEIFPVLFSAFCVKQTCFYLTPPLPHSPAPANERLNVVIVTMNQCFSFWKKDRTKTRHQQICFSCLFQFDLHWRVAVQNVGRVWWAQLPLLRHSAGVSLFTGQLY